MFRFSKYQKRVGVSYREWKALPERRRAFRRNSLMVGLCLVTLAVPSLNVASWYPQILPPLVGVLSKPPAAAPLFTMRVNEGGSAYTDTSGRAWLPDTSGNQAFTVTDTIQGTADQAIYQSEAYGSPLAYSYTVPNGTYTVRLKFAEIYWDTAGQRVFDVYLQGNRVLQNYDILSLVPKFTARDETFQGIQVSNGVLTINMSAATDNAKLSGVELIETAAGGPPPAYTVYGGWTGGGPTVTVSNCGGSNDTTAAQNALNALQPNGTLDFSGSTPCAINAPGITVSGKSNIRITQSGAGGLKGVASSGGYSGHESSLLYVENGNNILIDKLKVDCNNTHCEGIYLFNSTNSSIQYTEVFSIALGGTPDGPYAGIKCDACVNPWIMYNKVHDTGGDHTDASVRGIWCGVGDSRPCTNPTIEYNTTDNTGHTGIVSESSGPNVQFNTCTRAQSQGTGMKFIQRGAGALATWSNNTIDGTYSGGIMLESADNSGYTNVDGNTFRNIGATGTSFSALYFGGGQSLYSRHVRFRNNNVQNSKSVVNTNFVSDLLVDNTTVTGGPATVRIEAMTDHVTINSAASSKMSVVFASPGTPPINNIFLDGSQMASIRSPFDTIVAALLPSPRFK
jgi:hypothetical protein